MALALAFVSAFLGTLLAGAAAKLLAAFFAPDARSARIGGFCVALGWAAGRYSYSGPLGTEAVVAAVAALGSLCALAVLWLWLIRSTGGPLSDG
jgi:hypothetical protein